MSGIYGNATGAYSEDFEIIYNFDLDTGNKILAKNIFSESGLKSIKKHFNLTIEKEIQSFINYLKNESKNEDNNQDDLEFINDQIDLYEYCVERFATGDYNFYKYALTKDSLMLVCGECSSHAVRALDDLGEFTIRYSYYDIEEHLSDYGKQLIFKNQDQKIITSPESKMYKGFVNEKYPITAIITEINSKGIVTMQYWYDKYKHPIELKGTFKNNHFSLTEYDYTNAQSGKDIPLPTIEADWLAGHKIIGEWINNFTEEKVKFELYEY